jgi:hypothetical protein
MSRLGIGIPVIITSIAIEEDVVFVSTDKGFVIKFGRGYTETLEWFKVGASIYVEWDVSGISITQN